MPVVNALVSLAHIGMTERRQPAPITQICAWDRSCSNAPVGGQIGGSARVLLRPSMTQRHKMGGWARRRHAEAADRRHYFRPFER
jgi:hypothetical protein